MTLNVALTTFRGTGRLGDPFRPDVDGDFNGIIDLRRDKSAVDGFCLVAKSDDRFTGKGIKAQIGATEPGEPGNLLDGDNLGPLARTLLGNLFNKDFSGLTNLRMLVREVVWKFHGELQLDQSVNGFPIWLDGKMVDWLPQISGGFVDSDSFTYSNGALSTVSGGIWVNKFGNMDINSNIARMPFAASYCVAYFKRLPYTPNTFSRIQVVNLTSGPGFNYVAARVREEVSATDNNYQLEHGFGIGTTDRDLLRHDAGTVVALSQSSTAFPAFPYYIRCEANGSSIYGICEADSVAHGPVTDATYKTGAVGFQIYADDGVTAATADNWSGGDLDQTMRMHGNMGNARRRRRK